METSNVYEIIGYAASLLVAVSLMMSAIVKLRIVNLIGSFTFSVYGILIGSIPVAAMNGFIVLINIYYLVQIYRDNEYFQLLNADHSDAYLKAFLEFYEESITGYQPDFRFTRTFDFSMFVLRDMVPAGLVLGHISNKNELNIDLDFVIPDYRDFKIGNYLFVAHKDYFREMGVQTIRASAGNNDHNLYLEKVGFRRTDNANYPYCLML